MFETCPGAVTLTELERIRYTMETLKKSESVLEEKLSDPATETYFPTIIPDLHRHALEILWGWEQLYQRICMLPESFFDKYSYREKAGHGIDRIKVLAFYTRHLLRQQYVRTNDDRAVRDDGGE